jgi:hypothetical protein
MNPSLAATVRWLERGIDNSGIFEFKALRDHLDFLYGPEPFEFDFYFDPNNAGPLYFLVCLTLGIVVPGGS